jgi:ankyrin repeat protein
LINYKLNHVNGDKSLDSLSINHIDSDGYSALMYACKLGYSEIITLLLTSKANTSLINPKTSETALLLSCINNQYLSLKLLLEHQYQVNDINYSSIDINQSLKGFDMTGLMWGCDKGYTNIVKLLLKYNADTSIVNKYGSSATTYARTQKIIDMINESMNESIVLK